MTAVQQRNLIAPSPVFYGLVGLVVALGTLLWKGYEFDGVTIFLFVVAGWVLSLAFHEFGHALVAYIGGDRSVLYKGYLTLDVRKYVEVGTSLLFPILILVIGGIGLPGGAVWIQPHAIRSTFMRSLTSAAGPIATAICGLVCLLPIRFGWIDAVDHRAFLLGLSFLGAVQVFALIFNLVPVPGLDGFGIIEPYLSVEARQAVRPLRQYGILIFIAALWFLPPVRDRFWDITDAVAEVFGGESISVLWRIGFNEFQFWE